MSSRTDEELANSLLGSSNELMRSARGVFVILTATFYIDLLIQVILQSRTVFANPISTGVGLLAVSLGLSCLLVYLRRFSKFYSKVMTELDGGLSLRSTPCRVSFPKLWLSSIRTALPKRTAVSKKLDRNEVVFMVLVRGIAGIAFFWTVYFILVIISAMGLFPALTDMVNNQFSLILVALPVEFISALLGGTSEGVKTIILVLIFPSSVVLYPAIYPAIELVEFLSDGLIALFEDILNFEQKSPQNPQAEFFALVLDALAAVFTFGILRMFRLIPSPQL